MDVVTTILVILGIAISLIFNYSNGKNNASNAIATVVATHAMTPRKALIFAAICCLIGPFLFSTAVAKTIGAGVIDTSIFTPVLLLVGLCGSVLWVNFCSYVGIPVSSSHALVGGILGAGIAAGGFGCALWPSGETLLGTLIFVLLGAAIGFIIALILALIFKEKLSVFLVCGAAVGGIFGILASMIAGALPSGGILAILLFICVSPMLGLTVSYTFTAILTRIIDKRSNHPMKMNKWFQRLQVVGAGFQALSIGGNDAQNAMGVIFAILVSIGAVTATSTVPLWVVIICSFAIALGMICGGLNIIKKVGSGITRIMPYQGFSASMSSGGVLALVTALGIPVSTTHVASGAIIGTGITRGAGLVNWKTVIHMVVAWVLTIPCAAIVSGLAYLLVSLIFGL